MTTDQELQWLFCGMTVTILEDLGDAVDDEPPPEAGGSIRG